MEIPREYFGWWRIISTSQWVDESLGDLGTPLISLTGYDDRLRMHTLLAYVNCRPTKSGVSFTWQGAWEWDPMSGTGSVRLHKDGRLSGEDQDQERRRQHLRRRENRSATGAHSRSTQLPRQVATTLVAAKFGAGGVGPRIMARMPMPRTKTDKKKPVRGRSSAPDSVLHRLRAEEASQVLRLLLAEHPDLDRGGKAGRGAVDERRR